MLTDYQQTWARTGVWRSPETAPASKSLIWWKEKMQMVLSRALTHSIPMGDLILVLLLSKLFWLTICTGFETFGHSSPLWSFQIIYNWEWNMGKVTYSHRDMWKWPNVGRVSIFRYLNTRNPLVQKYCLVSFLLTLKKGHRRCAKYTVSSELPMWTCKLLTSFFLREKADVSPHPFSSLANCEGELRLQNTGQLQFPSFQSNVC